MGICLLDNPRWSPWQQYFYVDGSTFENVLESLMRKRLQGDWQAWQWVSTKRS